MMQFAVVLFRMYIFAKKRPKKCNEVNPMHEKRARVHFDEWNDVRVFRWKAPRSFVGKSNHDSSFMARATFILSNSSTVTAMLKAIKDVL